MWGMGVHPEANHGGFCDKIDQMHSGSESTDSLRKESDQKLATL